jgi:hypothetical protein
MVELTKVEIGNSLKGRLQALIGMIRLGVLETKKKVL